MRHQLRPLAVVLIAMFVAACATTPAASPGALTVTDAWARATATVDRPGGAYLVITNGTNQADALVSASSPAAASVEVHETTMASGGMMGMQEVPRIDVPAGATVKLEPGGYHLMLMGLVKPLAVGDTIELALTFERAGTIKVQAAVREG